MSEPEPKPLPPLLRPLQECRKPTPQEIAEAEALERFLADLQARRAKPRPPARQAGKA